MVSNGDENIRRVAVFIILDSCLNATFFLDVSCTFPDML